MPIGLDHTILEVHDLTESLSFYREVVGLEYKGKDGPFEGLLITPDLALELYDEWPVGGPRHLAFAMDRATFEATFERVRNFGIAYGDGPSHTENMKGPGPSSGVHGSTDSVYFKDPNGHILEILTYDQAPPTKIGATRSSGLSRSQTHRTQTSRQGALPDEPRSF